MDERHDNGDRQLPEGRQSDPKGANAQRVIEITESDLPLHCPMPQHTDWDAHPRVYLPIEVRGDALCPYCGTLYRLKGRPSGSAH